MRCPSLTRACCTVFRHISTAIFVRLLYIAYAIFVFIFKAIVRSGGAKWFDWFMLFISVFIVIEMLYTAIRRKGKEWKWISASTFTFLLAILPCVWELILCDGQCPQGNLKEIGIEIIALGMVFLIMFGKWMGPKGKLTAQEHSILLIGILATGADITSILDLAAGDMVIVVLLVYTLGLLQLCFSTSAVKTLPVTNPEDINQNQDKPLSMPGADASPTQDVENSTTSIEMPRGGCKSNSSIRCNLFCFYNYIWALVLGLMCQDIPFLAVRLTFIFARGDQNFSTLYFAIKNVVVITLVLNRIRTIFKEEHKPWKQQCGDLSNYERGGRRFLDSQKIGVETPNIMESDENPAP